LAFIALSPTSENVFVRCACQCIFAVQYIFNVNLHWSIYGDGARAYPGSEACSKSTSTVMQVLIQWSHGWRHGRMRLMWEDAFQKLQLWDKVDIKLDYCVYGREDWRRIGEDNQVAKLLVVMSGANDFYQGVSGDKLWFA
jgi:hypothetical protein